MLTPNWPNSPIAERPDSRFLGCIGRYDVYESSRWVLVVYRDGRSTFVGYCKPESEWSWLDEVASTKEAEKEFIASVRAFLDIYAPNVFKGA